LRSAPIQLALAGSLSRRETPSRVVVRVCASNIRLLCDELSAVSFIRKYKIAFQALGEPVAALF
jgi:hypothetical protein